MLDQEINEQLGLLQNELIRLKTVTDYLDNAKENSESIIIELEKVQVNYTNYTDKIFNLYKQYVSELKLNTENQINVGVTKFETTGDKIDKTNSEKLIETKRLLEQYKHVVEATDNLVKTLESVDFPKRLSDIDLKIVEIDAAIHNLETIANDNQNTILQLIIKQKKESKINTVVICVLIIICTCAIIFLKK
jgi:Holliday junction resolvase RusA-like endonuclease